MTRAVFGQRQAKVFAITHDEVLKDHADYRKVDIKTDRNRARRFRGMVRWVSFCAVGLVATFLCPSEQIVSVVQNVGKALTL